MSSKCVHKGLKSTTRPRYHSQSNLWKHLTSVTLQMTGASFFCRSFYNWKTQVSASNSSPNFEVIYDDPSGLLFRSKRDKKILNVDPSVGFVDAVFLTWGRQMGLFIRSVHLFNNSKNVSGNHKPVRTKRKNLLCASSSRWLLKKLAKFSPRLTSELAICPKHCEHLI